MFAQDLMSHPAVTCHVNDSLNIAAQKMWDHDCGALPIVNDEGKLTGMITDRDICMAALTRGRRLDELLVNGTMSSHVVAVSATLPIGEVEHLMSKYQVRRLPVIDGDGIPVGVISLNDLAIEAARRDTEMKHGPSKIARTLAAICQPRQEKHHAA